ncbi:MAG: feruloyl-CoA synthase [Gemmatimonadota bacterium]|nr:MAG: feruloyl-CoA synthase [Gemmatimonadota bacterium]
MAERRDSDWHRITYGTALERARATAQFLIDRGFDHTTPVAILSGNSIRHALVALGASLVGVPIIPITPAYSLMSRDHRRLQSIIEMLQPKMVFAEDPQSFAQALQSIDLHGRLLVTASSASDLPNAIPFEELVATRVKDEQLRRRMVQIDPSHTAKYMLTSGSTATPKPVITTHEMLCANQQMIAQLWPFLETEPPILVDWLPWSHTYGGGKIFNLTMWHGGTLYIDGGRPVPGAMEITLQNLREISPTVYFNVPRGFALLAPSLETDSALRESFFARLQMISFAAAALPDDLWMRLREVSMMARGGQPVFISAGYGSTETSPTSTLVHSPIPNPRAIGLPPPGVELKLVPAEAGKMELRVRGPHITPGYHKDPELTREAFDDEGYFRIGDAVSFVDPSDPAKGLVFDGRMTEDFKLTTGTWVNAGKLRIEILASTAPLLSDVVPTAPDRDYLGLLAWLSPAATEPSNHAAAITELTSRLRTFNMQHPGTSKVVRRILLLSEPPSFEEGEVTDKQYVNQRVVRDRRKADVDRLYANPLAPDVIEII